MDGKFVSLIRKLRLSSLRNDDIKRIYEFIEELDKCEENIYVIFEKLYVFFKNELKISDDNNKFLQYYQLSVLWIRILNSHLLLDDIFDALFVSPLSLSFLINLTHKLKNNIETYQIDEIIQSLFNRILSKVSNINILIQNIELFKLKFDEKYINYKKIYNTIKLIS
jgi:hypothetical protein